MIQKPNKTLVLRTQEDGQFYPPEQEMNNEDVE